MGLLKAFHSWSFIGTELASDGIFYAILVTALEKNDTGKLQRIQRQRAQKLFLNGGREECWIYIMWDKVLLTISKSQAEKRKWLFSRTTEGLTWSYCLELHFGLGNQTVKLPNYDRSCPREPRYRTQGRDEISFSWGLQRRRMNGDLFKTVYKQGILPMQLSPDDSPDSLLFLWHSQQPAGGSTQG